jgi:glycosyltransferase involved in cell wall biosynthesis
MMVAIRAFPYLGGLETHVHEVASRLAAAAVDITILTTDPSGKLPESECREGVRIWRVRGWPSRPDYCVAPGIFEAIKRSGCDLLHLQGYHTLLAPMALLAATRASLPYVVSFHSGGHSSRLRAGLRLVQWRLLRPLLRRAGTLIAVSEFERRHFSQRLDLPLEQFRVIPNGSELPSAEAAGSATTEDVALILSVGRLEKYKGHQHALAALPALLEQEPKARLVILGSGPYEPQLKRLARKLKVLERVEIKALPGHDRLGMARQISQASLVTLLSEYESQGIAALEAMALRRPVLVAATSALRDLSAIGEVATVPLGLPPAALAAAMLQEMRRPRESVPPSAALPRWEDCAQGLLGVYRDMQARAGHLPALDRR